jgi:hypothetical protein
MNTIEVMKQARDALKLSAVTVDNFGVQAKTYSAIDALEQAIKQEEANIKTQITKDISHPVKTYSGGKAWPVQTEWVGLTDEEIKYFQMTKNVYPGITKEIEVRLKEKNSKAGPVEQDQVCPQKICWTPYDCENGRCTGSEKNEPIGRFNGKFRAGGGKMVFEVEVCDEKSLPAVFALIYTAPPKG